MLKGERSKKKNKFTIITPSFNQGRFIATTIGSVLSQIESEIEVEYLIYDGGSTDTTLSIIKRYAQKNRRAIHWESGSDRGQADAINKGMKKATGDYVAYINSDDYYLPAAFRTVANYFRTHPHTQWVIGDCSVSRGLLRPTFAFKHFWPLTSSWQSISLFNPINQPAVFLRTAFVRKIGLFRTSYKYAFDYDYWIRAYKKSPPARLKKALAMFRVHPSASGSKFFVHQFHEEFKILKKHTDSKIILLLHNLFSHIIITSYKLLK